jgi:hypothetical protein
VFVSGTTSNRMIEGIRDHNRQRTSEGRTDLKILPLCFDSLELWTTRLVESEGDLYPVDDFIRIFDHHTAFIDDLRILKLIMQMVFPNDADLAGAIEHDEAERDHKTLEVLINDLKRLEDYMRDSGVAVGHAAIDNLIYLVFLKLYEEKRERDGYTNRLRSEETFEVYRRDGVDPETRTKKRSIHKLFQNVKQESEFITARMFTEGDNLADSVNDDFIINHVIPIFSNYTFVGTRVDALGAVYEVLALRAAKDVKVGQFFTPEKIVRFMVAMTELNYKDMVLDPACGTGRFLIWAMQDMVGKVERSSERDKLGESKQVCLHRLFGSDIDPRIAKIAKMNMWVHGDGKSNIFGGPDYNGLRLHLQGFNGHGTFDNAFDVVLTNPPLGKINYNSVDFVGGDGDIQEKVRATLRRMPILPRRERRGVMEITGNNMKGGALFLAAIWHYLKGDSYPSNPSEWRGGKVLIILDEGILNTDSYGDVRMFIRDHFYIKAIISLTRDTFVPVSKTATKTSILYAVKKTDLSAVQKEPIFYGHVGYVGFDRKGTVCRDDLDEVLSAYFDFKRKVLESYIGNEFRVEKFKASGFQGRCVE